MDKEREEKENPPNRSRYPKATFF